ncbi:hypothetical protein [Devosia sp. RR2S18]|uniref:hypothetical protein n=1 Tax=Devosia rhizosphaerae TaxID=3049774 RepID=UPI002541923B|nr:hypothetical protein [Devosia sp. RR2S18]WIJ23482.1 hypothetical protein QOV41_10340 [Devosia sp. RR2S18]
MSQTVLSLAIALLLATVHIFGSRLAFLRVTPRSIWLSIAGGVSVAYVFVHILPELADHQESFREAAQDGSFLAALESHSYLVALVGLATFYGLDRLAHNSSRRQEKKGEGYQPSESTFWVHLASFAIYNVLIGYLLVHREDAGLQSLVIFAVAMALHFVVNDHALRDHHGRIYDHRGRWLLAAAPVLGWVCGVLIELPQLAIGALFALLAGSVVLNVMKEELPEERESRFWAFALGAAGYAALLLLL